MEPELDPLISTQEIVEKYHDFINYAIQILQQPQSNQEPEAVKLRRRIEMVEKLEQLVKDVTVLVRNTFREMAWLKDCSADDSFAAKKYALREDFIPCMLGHLRIINSRLVASTSLVEELRSAEQQLSLVITIVKAVRRREINPDN